VKLRGRPLCGSLVGPSAPMRGVNDNGFRRLRMHPPGLRPAAREDQRIDFALLNHTELQITIERRARYGLPI
jgi:hypothetical protein